MTIASPTPRKGPKIDLSGLDDEQRLMRERVIRLGEYAFGARWQSDMAAALTKLAGRRVGQVQIAQWVSGYRPVSEALVPALGRLVDQAVSETNRRTDRVLADWKGPPVEDVDAIENA